MHSSGYSGTPLAKKLGIKQGFRILILDPPAYYFDLFDDLPDVELTNDVNKRKDFIHFFVKQQKELSGNIKKLKEQLGKNGMIWISWPKKASKMATDITEDVIRALALKNGLVDVKVCAIDDVWSGLKLVIPVKDRK